MKVKPKTDSIQGSLSHKTIINHDNNNTISNVCNGIKKLISGNNGIAKLRVDQVIRIAVPRQKDSVME